MKSPVFFFSIFVTKRVRRNTPPTAAAAAVGLKKNGANYNKPFTGAYSVLLPASFSSPSEIAVKGGAGGRRKIVICTFGSAECCVAVRISRVSRTGGRWGGAGRQAE